LHTRPNMFMGKVFMHTNNQLQVYRNNGTFLEYLKQESSILDINNLDDINLVIIGYLEYYIPRYESINIQTNRIKTLLPANAANFQLRYGILWGEKGERTRVAMIKCDEQNVEELLQEFENLHESNALTFFPWTDFLSCTTEQRTTIVQRIYNWRALHRRILIPGFQVNNDNVPMITIMWGYETML
jgi:hypothetical protein